MTLFTTAVPSNFRLRAFLLSCLVAAMGGLGLSASDPSAADDCAGDAPLIEATVPLDAVCREGLAVSDVIGEWRLPVSPRKPEVLTAARLRLRLSEGTSRAPATASSQSFQAEFSFPDPQPYGLPFTFQRLDMQLESVESAVVTSGSLDWSFSCTNPGRSIFPGQGFEDVVSMPCPAPEQREGLILRVRLWGARM